MAIFNSYVKLPEGKMIVDDEAIQINLWTMVILNSYVQ